MADRVLVPMTIGLGVLWNTAKSLAFIEEKINTSAKDLAKGQDGMASASLSRPTCDGCGRQTAPKHMILFRVFGWVSLKKSKYWILGGAK